MSEPRARTEEEVRTLFLDIFRHQAKHWASIPKLTPLQRCNGLAFSILNIFDGTTLGFPGMDLTLTPHEDDMEYHKSEGENYFEPGMRINDCMLHELYYKENM